MSEDRWAAVRLRPNCEEARPGQENGQSPRSSCWAPLQWTPAGVEDDDFLAFGCIARSILTRLYVCGGE